MMIQKVENICLNSEEIDILKQAKELMYQIYISTEDNAISSYSRDGVDGIEWIIDHSKNVDE